LATSPISKVLAIPPINLLSLMAVDAFDMSPCGHRLSMYVVLLDDVEAMSGEPGRPVLNELASLMVKDRSQRLVFSPRWDCREGEIGQSYVSAWAQHAPDLIYETISGAFSDADVGGNLDTEHRVKRSIRKRETESVSPVKLNLFREAKGVDQKPPLAHLLPADVDADHPAVVEASDPRRRSTNPTTEIEDHCARRDSGQSADQVGMCIERLVQGLGLSWVVTKMEAVAVKETSVVSDEIEVCPHSANRPSPTDHQGEPHATSCPQFRCPFRWVQPRRAITGRGYVVGRNTTFVSVHHLPGETRQLLTHGLDS
jgi:hypothetical protein